MEACQPVGYGVDAWGSAPLGPFEKLNRIRIVRLRGKETSSPICSLPPGQRVCRVPNPLALWLGLVIPAPLPENVPRAESPDHAEEVPTGGPWGGTRAQGHRLGREAREPA